MYLKQILVLLLVAVSFLGCTRDDICTEETPKTPLLKVKFFDADNPDTPKPVTNFSIVLEGEDYLLFDPITTDSATIPLQTHLDNTNYVFLKNYTSDTVNNYDLIRFNYMRQEEYISRACGFRVQYTQLDATLEISPTTNWIQSIEIVNDSINILRPNDTHLHIYH
jgi:hypothetical protein